MDFEYLRQRLVERLKLEGVIKSAEVERAFLTVPREEFVPERYRPYAYEDTPLPILEGQTISAPHMCAMMCEALGLRKGMTVLEVGTGSGYHAALCAEIVSPTGEEVKGFVLTLEYFKTLARFAKENLDRTGYSDRVYVVTCDGSSGAPSRLKFDCILVTAAAPQVPKELLDQLKVGGRMVIPVGTEFFQELLLVLKVEEGRVVYRSLGGCIFVKLRGRYGFR